MVGGVLKTLMDGDCWTQKEYMNTEGPDSNPCYEATLSKREKEEKEIPSTFLQTKQPWSWMEGDSHPQPHTVTWKDSQHNLIQC